MRASKVAGPAAAATGQHASAFSVATIAHAVPDSAAAAAAVALKPAAAAIPAAAIPEQLCRVFFPAQLLVDFYSGSSC
jgi:hypothetical protein